MGKKANNARSSQLTGGEGFTYEDVVVAYFLAALLREEAALGQPGYVTRVAVQQDRQGEPMDDVIVDSDAAGDRNRLSVQVKRSVTISQANDDFKQIIANAVATRAKTEFRPGLDRYGFIVRAVADSRFQSLQRIIELAKASPTGPDFANRFKPAGESSKEDIALRDKLLTLIQPVDADAEADFYRHFIAHRLDGFESGGDRLTDLSNRLGAVSANGDGSGLAEILCRQVRVGEGAAKVWTRASLIADLRTLHPLAVAPSYAEDIRIIEELARNAVADIRSDIGGVMVARDGLVEAAEQAAAAHVFSNINGLPGCGKSVVMKRCVERAMQKGPALFLKSDRLEGASWRIFANALGLGHQYAVDVLAEIGASGSAILFIDGIDRIKQEQRGIVTDLLHTIENEAALSYWRVLVTSRDQGLEVLRSWIPARLYSKTGVGNVAVETLDDSEAEDLVARRPELQSLLFGTAAVREIARRPFFAAVLADQGSGRRFRHGGTPTPDGERAYRSVVVSGWLQRATRSRRWPTTCVARSRGGRCSFLGKGYPWSRFEVGNDCAARKPKAGQDRRRCHSRLRLQIHARHLLRVGVFSPTDRSGR